jgi:hypothetical protein
VREDPFPLRIERVQCHKSPRRVPRLRKIREKHLQAFVNSQTNR